MTRTVGGSIEELRAAIAGVVFTPEDPQYDQARLLWNADADRRPADSACRRRRLDSVLVGVDHLVGHIRPGEASHRVRGSPGHRGPAVGLFAGQEIRLDGKDLFIMKEDDVLAVLDQPKKKT